MSFLTFKEFVTKDMLTPQLFTAEDFYNRSKRIKNILDGYELHYGITDGGLSVAQGLEAWLIAATELTLSEPHLIKHMDERLVNVFQWGGSRNFNQKLNKYRWNDVATAIKHFIRDGGSERNMFVPIEQYTTSSVIALAKHYT